MNTNQETGKVQTGHIRQVNFQKTYGSREIVALALEQDKVGSAGEKSCRWAWKKELEGERPCA
jgi:hypothetical protein